MFRSRKILIIIGLALVLVAGVMQAGTVRTHSQGTIALDDPWLQKPVLSYLLLTKDQRLEEEAQNLFTALSLSEKEKETIRQIAIEEQQQLQSLYAETQTIVRNEALSPSEKEKAMQGARYNERVVAAMMRTDRAVKQLLGTRYSLFRSWIIDWWGREQKAIADLLKYSSK